MNKRNLKIQKEDLLLQGSDLKSNGCTNKNLAACKTAWKRTKKLPACQGGVAAKLTGWFTLIRFKRKQ